MTFEFVLGVYFGGALHVCLMHMFVRHERRDWYYYVATVACWLPLVIQMLIFHRNDEEADDC